MRGTFRPATARMSRLPTAVRLADRSSALRDAGQAEFLGTSKRQQECVNPSDRGVDRVVDRRVRKASIPEIGDALVRSHVRVAVQFYVRDARDAARSK